MLTPPSTAAMTSASASCFRRSGSQCRLLDPAVLERLLATNCGETSINACKRECLSAIHLLQCHPQELALHDHEACCPSAT